MCFFFKSNFFQETFFIPSRFIYISDNQLKITHMKSQNSLEIPPPILHLADALKPYGISTGEVKKGHDLDGFYIPNAPQSPHFFQMIYNLDPDWGPIGFQIFSEDGDVDIYLGGDNVEAALKAIVEYLEKI